MPAEQPQSVGKYRVDSVLGEGAMGVVYKGHDPDIDRTVAIKTLHAHLMSDSERAAWLERFAREARAAGRVLHGNLVTIFDYLEQDAQPYLVMEFIESETVGDRLRRPPLPPLGEAQSIMVQMLAGLDAIHGAGIIHRDVKPANALLLPDGRLKIADFGVARVESLGATYGGMIGTPDYMSPEQFAGQQVDARADLFAAGVIFFELLTGRKPFQASGLGELSQKVMSGNALALLDIAPELPQSLDDIMRRALAVEPAARFATARDFAAAINAAMRTLDAQAMESMERTIVAAPRSAAPAAPMSQTMADLMPRSAMEKIERLLAEQIGPIAKHLMRKVSSSTSSTDQLVDKLSAEITPEQREKFRNAVKAMLGGSQTQGGLGLDEATLDAMTQYLLPHLGPIAKVLVRRTAKTCRNRAELCESLAGHIDSDSARRAFLSEMG
ncbi:serine/threonine protein kinase [Abyssibius alkaniclasticus]|uniref:serine/threonine-protein kinase n=1 Tax=Abyssibius alkaniclasticus TaxID=2881234 RepID=UPI002363F726|nr:serine/threonine-protein kinase [Abyssibius alkaniclasticus]UPH72376.1 serine/threonine protein kinase [Abyssibius alkaniclasticus]